jgi:Flp pilus assembly protein TadG
MRRIESLRTERGQAAVELALVLPIMVAVVLAIAQFAIAFNNYLVITDATRAGARQAVVARFSGDQGAAAVQTVKNSAGDLDVTKLGVSVSATNWNVSGSDVTVTTTYPYAINIFGWVVQAGTLKSTQTELLE